MQLATGRVGAAAAACGSAADAMLNVPVTPAAAAQPINFMRGIDMEESPGEAIGAIVGNPSAG